MCEGIRTHAFRCTRILGKIKPTRLRGHAGLTDLIATLTRNVRVWHLCWIRCERLLDAFPDVTGERAGGPPPSADFVHGGAEWRF